MKPSRVWGFSVPRAAIYDISRVHNIIFAHRTVFCDVSFFTLTLSTTSYAIILSGSVMTDKATTSRSYNSEMAAASSEPRLCSCVSNYLRVITPYSPLTSRQRCSSNFWHSTTKDQCENLGQRHQLRMQIIPIVVETLDV
jgi:hypothetical protein